MKVFFKLFGICFLFGKYPQISAQTDSNQILNSRDGDRDISRSFSSGPRPFYNIGHMCNSIKRTSDSLGRGANAVEVDVSFKDDDIYLYHGYPCDCFRFCWEKELLSKYLTHFRKVTTPGNSQYNPRFVLLYFDIKLKPFNNEEKFTQGVRMANHLAIFYFNEMPVKSTLRFIVAISYADDSDFIVGFIHQLKTLKVYDALKDYIGFDIGIEYDTDRTRTIWRRMNITNVWQGEGITNCINPVLPHTLEKLVRIRDSPDSYMAKVYRWTIDLTDSIRAVLQFDIDGLMTNHPERIVQIIYGDHEFQGLYRLATIHDNPYQRFIRTPKTLRLQPKNKSGLNIPGVIRDMRDSLMRFFREIVSVVSG